MIITWYGHSCFKIQTRPKRGGEEITIFTDPFDKSIGLRPPQGQANIVTISHDHHDHNNPGFLKGDLFKIDAPGEYSINGVTIEGVDSFHDKNSGSESGRNTIFIFESEDVRLCHLGDLGHKLNEKQLDKINGVDILMIPVGGKYTISAQEAEQVIGQIEPKIIIPMHYRTKGTNIQDIDDEKAFCSELGNCPKEKIQKFTFKKKDIENKENEIVLFEIANS